MATGNVISEVFCAAATMTLPLAPFSQYSRPAEVAVFVSQYSVFRRRRFGIVAIRPLRKTRMHKDPCRKPGRGIRGAITDGLRPRGHHREIREIPVLRRGH